MQAYTIPNTNPKARIGAEPTKKNNGLEWRVKVTRKGKEDKSVWIANLEPHDDNNNRSLRYKKTYKNASQRNMAEQKQHQDDRLEAIDRYLRHAASKSIKRQRTHPPAPFASSGAAITASTSSSSSSSNTKTTSNNGSSKKQKIANFVSKVAGSAAKAFSSVKSKLGSKRKRSTTVAPTGSNQTTSKSTDATSTNINQKITKRRKSTRHGVKVTSQTSKSKNKHDQRKHNGRNGKNSSSSSSDSGSSNRNKILTFKKQEIKFAKSLGSKGQSIFHRWFTNYMVEVDKRKNFDPSHYHNAKRAILKQIDMKKKRALRDKYLKDADINLQKTIKSMSFEERIIRIDENKKNKKNKTYTSRYTTKEYQSIVIKTIMMQQLIRLFQRTSFHVDENKATDKYANQKDARKEIAELYDISEETIRLYYVQFRKNGWRFHESRAGKFNRTTIFDRNPLMKGIVRRYLKRRVSEKIKKGQPAFKIQELQEYLNKEGGLFHRHNIPRTAIHKSKRYNEDDEMVKEKTWLTVSLSTTRRYARSLGLSYIKSTKSFHVDGHENEDVIDYRQNKWLPMELRLELIQYRWLQFTLAEAREKYKVCYVNGLNEEIKKTFEENKKKTTKQEPLSSNIF